jgi:hypothetical protein
MFIRSGDCCSIVLVRWFGSALMRPPMRARARPKKVSNLFHPVTQPICHDGALYLTPRDTQAALKADRRTQSRAVAKASRQ